MADLTLEQFEQVPDFLKTDYTEVDGAYKHIGLMTVKKTADELNGKLKATETSLADVNGRLDGFEELKSKQLQEAREKALLEAKEANNVDDILRLEREVLADERKVLLGEREEFDVIKTTLAEDKKNSLADKMGAFATKDGLAAFTRLVKDFIFVDKDTRQVTLLNDDGSASSITDVELFIKESEKKTLFKPLMKASITTEGGGLANGSQDGRASGGSGKTAQQILYPQYNK